MTTGRLNVHRQVRDHGFNVLRELSRLGERLEMISALMSSETHPASQQLGETALKIREDLKTIRGEFWVAFSEKRRDASGAPDA